MRFAICDDDKSIVDEIRPIINSFANEKRFEAVIDCFYSGEALLASDTVFDFIILDYQMGELNGLNTARVLREKQCTCTIIFLTNFTHFVLDAFTVNAYRFLEKPLKPELLTEALASYFEMFGANYPLLLKSKYETVCVEANDIVYLEAAGRNCEIYLQKSSFCCSNSMTAICGLLPRSNFYKVNRAYIVNFNYIEKYNSEFIYFKNGERVHISRNYVTAFKTAYLEYTQARKI